MLRPWKLQFQLKKGSDKPVYIQIADAIIEQIQSGRLVSGQALPGSRDLSAMLNVNRNTIVESLQVLLNEGWLVSKERKGTFVADPIPGLRNKKQKPFQRSSVNIESDERCRIIFDDGHPDSKIAPVNELARAYRQLFSRKAKWQMMGYGHAQGDSNFRKTIVHMLNHQRGMQLDDHSICMTRGSQMAMYLAAHTLLEAGSFVMVEHPGYRPAWQAFENAGAQLLPVRVDAEGLIIEDVINHLRSRKKIKALYTTPHRQYPTTVTLTLSRRHELIRLSNEYGFTIIEDDYDNEFHFGYRPIMPLSSSSELKQYIYIGTMSKVVAPALRIGYLGSNDYDFIRRVGELRKIIDVQGDSIMEQAILQLIEDGTLKKHIRKATLYYKAKRDFTSSLLDKYIGEKIHYQIPDGGLAFWLVPEQKKDWSVVSSALKKRGVKIITPDSFSLDTTINGIRLGYASLSEQQLREGIKAIADIL